MSYNNLPPHIRQTLDNLIITHPKTTYWTSNIDLISLKDLLHKTYEIRSDVINKLETNGRKKKQSIAMQW